MEFLGKKMIICPCGMTIDDAKQTTSWPPYRFASYDKNNEIIYAMCVHGVVIVDKVIKTCDCGEMMKIVDNWFVCTKCWKHEERIYDGRQK